MKLSKMTAIAAAMVMAAAPAIAAELKFANFTPPFHTVNAAVIEKLNADLSAATGGELTVRGYHGGELGKGPVEQYVRAVQGVAEITWGLPGYTSSQFQKTMIAELPDTLGLDDSGSAAIWAAYDDHLAGEFPGTKPLAIWTSEPNVLIMKNKVVRMPSDLSGLKIRVAGATAAKVAEALGATPVQMPINQVYSSLDTGLIDGVITGSTVLKDFKIAEVAGSVTTGANLGRLTFYVVMGQQAYDALSDDEKAAIDAATGLGLSQNAEDAWFTKAATVLEGARADDNVEVVDLTEAEAAAFSEAVSAVRDDYVASVGGEAALAAMQGN